MSHYADENQDGIPDLAPEKVGASQDARNRALRTFLQGLGTDLAIALVLFLFPLVNSREFDFSNAEWTVLGLALAKTLVQTVVAYLMRKLRVSPNTITV